MRNVSNKFITPLNFHSHTEGETKCRDSLSNAAFLISEVPVTLVKEQTWNPVSLAYQKS